MVAENAVNFLVDNYPSRTMPTGANFETFGFSMGQGTPAEACVTKTIVAGSGTPGSLACAWTGSAGIGNNVTRDHESFSGKKSCRVGDYVEEEHPHLHHMSGSPKELWINGDITIKHCGGCFDDAEAHHLLHRFKYQFLQYYGDLAIRSYGNKCVSSSI